MGLAAFNAARRRISPGPLDAQPQVPQDATLDAQPQVPQDATLDAQPQVPQDATLDAQPQVPQDKPVRATRERRALQQSTGSAEPQQEV